VLLEEHMRAGTQSDFRLWWGRRRLRGKTWGCALAARIAGSRFFDQAALRSG
jgi:hypothetical protein